MRYFLFSKNFVKDPNLGDERPKLTPSLHFTHRYTYFAVIGLNLGCLLVSSGGTYKVTNTTEKFNWFMVQLGYEFLILF